MITMKSLEDVLKEEMKDLEFKKEWDALESEFQRIRQELNSKNNSSPAKYENKKRNQSAISFVVI